MEDTEFLEERNKINKTGKAGLQYVIRMLVTVTIFFLLAVLIRQMTKSKGGIALVRGNSMYPTYHDGQMICYHVEDEVSAGDIVLFQGKKEQYGSDEVVIKRVIAQGGETVECRDGIIYVDGLSISEDYLESRETDDFNAVTVPEGKYFVMGDNRTGSTDSREVGAIDASQIFGTVARKEREQY